MDLSLASLRSKKRPAPAPPNPFTGEVEALPLRGAGGKGDEALPAALKTNRGGALTVVSSRQNPFDQDIETPDDDDEVWNE